MTKITHERNAAIENLKKASSSGDVSISTGTESVEVIAKRKVDVDYDRKLFVDEGAPFANVDSQIFSTWGQAEIDLGSTVQPPSSIVSLTHDQIKEEIGTVISLHLYDLLTYKRLIYTRPIDS